MNPQDGATADDQNTLTLSTHHITHTHDHADIALTRYQSFVSMLDHPMNYQSINPSSYSGYHHRQMQFMAVKAMRSQQERERNVQRKLGIGLELLTDVDLAAIQGFQKEAKEAMLDYKRQLDSQATSTPEYFPEVPAGWTGNSKQPDRVVVSVDCVEKRVDAQSSVVLTKTIEARPFQRQDPSYLNSAERKLLAKKQAEYEVLHAEKDATQSKNKKPSQSAPRDTLKQVTLSPDERISEEPEPLVRDTSSFIPTPQSLIVQRMDNLQRLRNAVNIIVMRNRAQRALRQIQSAYAEFLPIYLRRNQQLRDKSAISSNSQQRRLVGLILEKKCAENVTQTYNELLSLVDKYSNQIDRHNDAEHPTLTFNTRLTFRPPPVTVLDSVSLANTDKSDLQMGSSVSRTIPELLFYRFSSTRGCNDKLYIDRKTVREEQISIILDFI